MPAVAQLGRHLNAGARNSIQVPHMEKPSYLSYHQNLSGSALAENCNWELGLGIKPRHSIHDAKCQTLILSMLL